MAAAAQHPAAMRAQRDTRAACPAQWTASGPPSCKCRHWLGTDATARLLCAREPGCEHAPHRRALLQQRAPAARAHQRTRSSAAALSGEPSVAEERLHLKSAATAVNVASERAARGTHAAAARCATKPGVHELVKVSVCARARRAPAARTAPSGSAAAKPALVPSVASARRRQSMPRRSTGARAERAARRTGCRGARRGCHRRAGGAHLKAPAEPRAPPFRRIEMSSPWRSSISESEGPLPARDLFPDDEWTAKLAVAPGTVYGNRWEQMRTNASALRVAPAGDYVPPFARGPATNPICFLGVRSGGVPLGRVVFELRAEAAPLAAENFRALCEYGVYKGSIMFRIFPDFIVQARCRGAACQNAIRVGEGSARTCLPAARGARTRGRGECSHAPAAPEGCCAMLDRRVATITGAAA